jgi:hypothetical protein
VDTLFLERMLLLLSQGSFTTTYKYALLLALIDVNVEGAGQGGPVTSVTTRQLAERVIVLYWPHTRPYARRRARLRRLSATPLGALTPHLKASRAGRPAKNSGAKHIGSGHALLQSSTSHHGARSQAEIVSLIAKTRAALHTVDPKHDRRPHLAQRADPAGYERLVRDVEWVLAAKPIPRLQVIGGLHEPFLYRLDWTVDQSPGRPIEPGLPNLTRRALRDGALSNALQLLPGVHERLVSLSAVLRPAALPQLARWSKRCWRATRCWRRSVTPRRCATTTAAASASTRRSSSTRAGASRAPPSAPTCWSAAA